MTSEDIYHIYKIRNVLTNEHYIGFTKNPTVRKATHFGPNRHGQSKLLYSKMKEYGDANFEFEVIYSSKDHNHTLNTMENYFIEEYDSRRNGYNRVPGGSSIDFKYETISGRISVTKGDKRKFIIPEVLDVYIENGWQRGVRKEVSNKMSKTKKSRNKTDTVTCIEITSGEIVQMTQAAYQAAKLAGTHIAKNHGMKNSNETRKKKSLAHKGVPKQDEHRKNLSEAAKKQHRIIVTSLYNKKEYDIGNFAIHLKQMAKQNASFDYFN